MIEDRGNPMTRPSGTEPADQELVKKAWAGDREAFNMLVSRHRQKAYQWAKRITNDAHLAEDFVQDALLRSFLAMAKKHCKKSGRFFVKMVVVIFEKWR